MAIQRRLPDFRLDVTFSSSAGRTVLFGPSGAGKSLTLQALAGLFPLDRGRILHGNEVWHDSSTSLFVPPQARHVGYLPQQYALFPHLTVSQNIAFGQSSRGLVASKRLAELIRVMQLDGLERARPAQLSGGQQQRVALARALASTPALLLLDEPWSALDAPVRTLLREEILHFHEQFQVPLLLVTHDTLDVQTLAEQVVVIAQGRVLQIGTPEQVFRAPRTRQVARLVGMNTCWQGTVLALEESPEGSRATLELADGVVRTHIAPGSGLVVGQRVELAPRADEIALLPAGSPLDNPACTYIEATVTREQARGAFYAVTVCMPSQAELEIPVPRWQRRELDLTPGNPVTLVLPYEAIHLFLPA